MPPSPKHTLQKIKVVAAPVRQQVADAIRNAIISLEFKPGDRLIERELCEMTGVSRTSLREGLRELETEGLIKNVPYKGLIVATVSHDEAANIYDVRSQLEGLLGRETALKRAPADLAALRANFAAVEAVVAARDFAALIGLKSEFYDILMRVTNNPILSDIVVNLQGRVAQFRATVMTREDRIAQSLDEMRTIIDAIEAQDATRAEAACIAHVRNAGDLVLVLLRELEDA
jgi:GntR family transcriptional regulator, trigonelline degradation regulator